jgi:hypothetical protein
MIAAQNHSTILGPARATGICHHRDAGLRLCLAGTRGDEGSHHLRGHRADLLLRQLRCQLRGVPRPGAPEGSTDAVGCRQTSTLPRPDGTGASVVLVPCWVRKASGTAGLGWTRAVTTGKNKPQLGGPSRPEARLMKHECGGFESHLPAPVFWAGLGRDRRSFTGPVVRRGPWPSGGRTRPGRSCPHPAAPYPAAHPDRVAALAPLALVGNCHCAVPIVFLLGEPLRAGLLNGPDQPVISPLAAPGLAGLVLVSGIAALIFPSSPSWSTSPRW